MFRFLSADVGILCPDTGRREGGAQRGKGVSRWGLVVKALHGRLSQRKAHGSAGCAPPPPPPPESRSGLVRSCSKLLVWFVLSKLKIKTYKRCERSCGERLNVF